MPETKNPKEAIKILPGYVACVRVRCGKSNCRCARGQRHVAYYHVTKQGGERERRYIRRAEVEQVRAACQAHRELQAELLAGRRQYSQLIRLAKAMFREMVGG